MGLSAPAEHRTVSYAPESQEGWVATRLDFLVNWARANSLWPMPFGTACCAIEFRTLVKILNSGATRMS